MPMRAASLRMERKALVRLLEPRVGAFAETEVDITIRSGMTCIINEQSLHLYDIITLTYEKDSCCFTDI